MAHANFLDHKIVSLRIYKLYNMNKPELISDKKVFGYEEEMLSPNHPSNLDDDDHFSARDKRESSMLDISN